MANTASAATPVATYAWTPASDRTLLLFALGRQLVTADYRKIARMLPGTIRSLFCGYPGVMLIQCVVRQPSDCCCPGEACCAPRTAEHRRCCERPVGAVHYYSVSGDVLGGRIDLGVVMSGFACMDRVLEMDVGEGSCSSLEITLSRPHSL